MADSTSADSTPIHPAALLDQPQSSTGPSRVETDILSQPVRGTRCTVSEILHKHETEFFEAVDPRASLMRLERKGVVTSDVVSRLEDTLRLGNAQEILFVHLNNVSVDALIKYCEVAISSEYHPKMQSFGKKVMEELQGASADSTPIHPAALLGQPQSSTGPSRVETDILSQPVRGTRCTVSEILHKHETEFFLAVDPRASLMRLERKGVVTSDVVSRLKDTLRFENAQEILFVHLNNVSVDALIKYCEVAISSKDHPKMQSFGKKVMEELQGASADPMPIHPAALLGQSQSSTGPSRVETDILSQPVRGTRCTVSEILHKHETEFFLAVSPWVSLMRLERKGVITSDVVSRIKDTLSSEDAQEILFVHLNNVSVDALIKYCEVAISNESNPKMQSFGKKVMEELQGALQEPPSWLPDYEEAVEKQGSVDVSINRNIIMGPPATGKSCLKHLLVHNKPKEAWLLVSDEEMASSLRSYLSRQYHGTVAIPKNPPEDGLAKRRQPLKKIDRSAVTSNIPSRTSHEEVSPMAGDSPLPLPSILPTSQSAFYEAHSSLMRDLSVGLEEELRLNGARFVHLLDTGSQPSFQDVLPLLLDIPCTYVHVFNAALDLDQPVPIMYRPNASTEVTAMASSETAWEMTLRSLSSIQALVYKVSRYAAALPMNTQFPTFRTVLVGTFKDQLIKSGIFAAAAAKISKRIKLLDKKPYYSHIVPNSNGQLFFLVNNMQHSEASQHTQEDQASIDDLRVVLSHSEGALKTKIPIGWFHFEMVTRKVPQKFFPFAELLEHARELKCVSSDNPSREFRSLLQLFHSLGVFTFVDHTGVSDTVCTDNSVFLQEVSKLLAIQFIKIPKCMAAKRFKITGILTLDEGLFNELGILKEVDPVWLLHCLCYLGVAACLSPPGATTAHYFMPAALPSKVSLESALGSVAPLLVTFEFDKNSFVSTQDLPRGIFTHLAVELANKKNWKVVPEKSTRFAVMFQWKKLHICVVESSRFISIVPRVSINARCSSAELHEYCSVVWSTFEVAIEASAQAVLGSKFTDRASTVYGFACPCETQPTHLAVQSEDSIVCNISSECQKYLKSHQVWFCQVEGAELQPHPSDSQILHLVDTTSQGEVREMWPLVAELYQASLITSEESERLRENLGNVVRIQICKSLEVVTKTADVLRRHGLEKESKVLSVMVELQQDDLITTEESENLSNVSAVVRVQRRKLPDVMFKTADILEKHGFVEETKSLRVFANLRQADLITSEDSERLSGLSDLVRVQGSKSLEILTKTADALRIAGLETESKLLTVMVELQQDDLITTEERENLSNVSAVVHVQRWKLPDVMFKTADILERHGFVEETKSLRDAAESKFAESLAEVLSSQANVTLQITKCTTIGPPRKGKTCLKHLLTGQKWDLEEGTASTDVMEAPEWVECYRMEEKGAEELWKLLSSENIMGELLLAITSVEIGNAHSDASPTTTPVETIPITSPDNTFPTDTLSDDSFTSTPNDVPPTDAISDGVNAPKDNLPTTTPDEAPHASIPRVASPTTRPSTAPSPVANPLMTGLTSRQQKLQDLLKHSEGKVLGGKSLVYFIDTGGQAIYHDVHPVLLTTPSVYLVVFSLKELHDRENEEERLKYFKSKLIQHPLRSIYTFGTRKFQGSYLLSYPEDPTVFIVGTHLDLIQEENGCEDFLSKLHEMICIEIGNKPYRQFVQYDPNGRSFWAVDNTKAGREQDENFKKYVLALHNAVLDPSMEMSVKVPLAWMLLKNVMDSEGMRCCHYSQLREKACSSKVVEESSASKDLDTLLRLFHMLGLVYHKVPKGYKKEESLVFIDPDCLYSATSDFLMAAKEEIEASGKDQQQRQAATMEEIEDIHGGSEEVTHLIQTATTDEHEFIQEDRREGQHLKQPATMELHLDEEVVGIVDTKKVMERIESKSASYQRKICTVLKTVEDTMDLLGQHPTEVVLRSLHAQLNKYCEELKQQCELSHRECPHVSSMDAKQQLLTFKLVHSLVSTVQGLLDDSAEKGEAHAKEVMENAIESVKAQCQSRLITDTEQFLAILADLRIVAKVDADRYVVPAVLPDVSHQIHREAATILVTMVSQTIMQACYLPSGLFCCLISELVTGLGWTVFPVGRTHIAFEQVGLPGGRVHIKEWESYIEVTLESEASPDLTQTCQTIRKEIQDSIIKVCKDLYNTAGTAFDEPLVWGFQCKEHQGTNEAETHIAAFHEDGGSFYAECLLQDCNAVQDVTSEQQVWAADIKREQDLKTESSSSGPKTVKASLPVPAQTRHQTPDPSDSGATSTKQIRFSDSSEPNTAFQADALMEVDADFKLTKCIVIRAQDRMEQSTEDQPWMQYVHVLSGEAQCLDMYKCDGKLPDKGHVLLLINVSNLHLYPFPLLITPYYCIYIITFDLPEGEEQEKAEKTLKVIHDTMKDVYAYSRDANVPPSVFLVGLQKDRSDTRSSFATQLERRLCSKPYKNLLVRCNDDDIYWTNHGEEFTIHGKTAAGLLKEIQRKSCLLEGLSHKFLARHCELHQKFADGNPFVLYEGVKEEMASAISDIVGSPTIEESLTLLHQFSLICYRSLSELESGLRESQNVVVLQPKYLRQLFEGVQKLRVQEKRDFSTITDLLNAHGAHVRDKKEWFQAMCISMGLVIERSIQPGKPPHYVFVMGLDPECNPPEREHYSVDPLLFTCWAENIVSKDDFFLPSSLFPAFVASFLKKLQPERPPFEMKRHYLYVRTRLQNNITMDVHVVERESFIEIGLQHLTAGIKHLTDDQVLDKLQLSCQGIKAIVIESAKQATDCSKLEKSYLKYGFLCLNCECDCFGEIKFDQDDGTIINTLTCSRWYSEQATTPQQQIWFNIVTNQMVVEEHVPNPKNSAMKIQIWKLKAISVCQASEQRPVSSSFPAVHEQTYPELKAVESGLTADLPHSREETDQCISSMLSLNVYGRSDYLELFRDYVSKNSADCGKAVLEKLGLTDAAIAECFRNNHGDVVEAVQDGLKQWSKGQGSRPSTWGVLLRAIEGNIAIQHRNKLKAILGQPAPAQSRSSDQSDSSASGTKRTRRLSDSSAPVQIAPDPSDSGASGVKWTRRLSDSSAPAQSTPDPSDSGTSGTMQSSRLSDSTVLAKRTPDPCETIASCVKRTRRLSDSSAPAQSTPDPSDSSASGTMQSSRLSDSTVLAKRTPDPCETIASCVKRARRLSDSSAPAQSTPDPSDSSASDTMQSSRLSDSTVLAKRTQDPCETIASCVKRARRLSDSSAPAQSTPDPNDSGASGTKQTSGSGVSDSTVPAQSTPDPGASGSKQTSELSDPFVEQVLSSFQEDFIRAVDAKANKFLSELVKARIIADDDQSTISQMTDKTEQNKYLYSHFMETCEAVDLMEVCDIIIAVQGNRRMNRLGAKMKDMLEKGLSGGVSPK